MTVVGIVGDVRYRRIDEASPPTMYVPLSQMPERSMTMVVRTQEEPLNLTSPIRDIVRAADPRVLLLNFRPMTTVVERALWQRRLIMDLLGLFAALALFLSTFGIYSLVSHGVMQRTPEIGVRIALGAEAGDIRRLVLRQGVLLTSGGIAAGLAGAFALSTLITSLLYGIEPTDPATIVLVCCVLFAAAILASYVPARRAARLDPMVALRTE
jgi:hypothetical protein